MESATLTRPAPPPRRLARLRAVPARTWACLAFGVGCLTTLVGFLVWPTYPNYDSYYSLIWGRELLHGHAPSFEVYRGPTEHPLAVIFGAVLSILGRPADRVMVFCTFVSFLLLVWGVYRLGRIAFTPLVGGVAALLLCSRFDFPFLAARAYVDIPYLAIVIWAVVLEAERPRRGMPVLILLSLAGMLRPEAWVLTGLYFLWIAWPADWPTRIKYAAVAAVGPLVWTGFDLAITGDPLFSLHSTSGLAEELGRRRSFSDLPKATPLFLRQLVKAPVFYGSLAGLALAAWFVPRRMLVPLAVLVAGIGTFVMVGAAGLSVIERYLLVPSLMLMIFAAVAVAGWTMLEPGTLIRKVWMAASLLVVLYGVVFTATKVNVGYFFDELNFRGDSHRALVKILDTKAVHDGLRCGPLSTPNHKLLPDSRWILNLPKNRVLARSDPTSAGRTQTGVALFVTNRTAIFRQAYTQDTDDPRIQIPDPRFTGPVATSAFYSAYERCTGGGR
jgi:hypothetical protein